MTATGLKRDTAVATRRPGARRELVPVVLMLVAVTLGSLFPLAVTPGFYYWDDTAGVAVGVWQRIAQDLLSGELPFLQLDMWRGGNFIAEAATGMWNPVMLGLMFGTYAIDNIAIAITLAKIVLFLITAAGTYVLARGYGANVWMAAVAGVVLPLSGWAFFMDGTSWVNGTAITAFTPWAWWAVRRFYLERGSFRSTAVAVVFGYLLLSVGNPYGVVALAAAFLAVAVEAIARRREREIGWLVGLGFGLVLLAVVVYLPFVLTSSVGFRADSSTYNDEFLSPNLSTLLGLSFPTFKPHIATFGLPFMTFPGAYLAWFILPLLPWLRWRSPGSNWKSLAGVLAFGAFYLFFLLGPTQLGMFRWPARLLPFFYLALLIVFVVVASHGLHASRRRARAIGSFALIVFSSWVSISDMPGWWKWHALALVMLLTLSFVFLRFGNVAARGFAVLTVGMLAVLSVQVGMAPSNQNVANYDLPDSRSELEATFGERYDGVTVQAADFMALADRLSPDDAWEHMLAGNMYSIAGVESTTAYSGVGYSRFDNALGIAYNGNSSKATWDALWDEPAGSNEKLVDLIRAETIVVLKKYLRGETVPDGWTKTDDSDLAVVLTRDAELSHPEGRVSFAGDDVTVHSDIADGDVREVLEVSAGSGAERSVVLARLAWPGYSATLDGEPVDLAVGPAGLLEFEVPADTDRGTFEIAFAPPGLAIGAGTAIAGIVLILALFFVRARRRGAEEARAE